MATLIVVGWCTVSVAFCYLVHRLAWQSSYYADPTRRLCGTHDRMLNWLTRQTMKFDVWLAAQYWKLRKRIGTEPAPRHLTDLTIYDGVKQWWWGRSVPQSNIEAAGRFRRRRKEMEL